MFFVVVILGGWCCRNWLLFEAHLLLSVPSSFYQMFFLIVLKVTFLTTHTLHLSLQCEPKTMISNILSDYELIVNEAIHLSGSIIDHVYINKLFLQPLSLESVETGINFVDHQILNFYINLFKFFIWLKICVCYFFWLLLTQFLFAIVKANHLLCSYNANLNWADVCICERICAEWSGARNK